MAESIGSKSFLLPTLTSDIENDPYLKALREKASDYRLRASTITRPEGSTALSSQDVRSKLLLTVLEPTEADASPATSTLNPLYELYYRAAIIEAVLKLISEGNYRRVGKGGTTFQPLLSFTNVEKYSREILEEFDQSLDDTMFAHVFYGLRILYLHNTASALDF